MTDPWTPVIDVSYAQGIIDFSVIKAAGVPGVIIRACNALKRDVRFDINWRAARDEGLDVAVYGFSNPKAAAGPNEQGAFLAELAHESSASWIMHDEESYAGEGGPNPILKGASAAAWLRAKVERCVADSQVAQILYTSKSYWDGTFTPGVIDKLFRFTDEWRADLEYLAQFDLILARYIAQRQGPPVYDALPRGVAPADWAAAVLANGKTPPIPKGFNGYVAHQFSAGGNGQGSEYGCTSKDLDLNIVRTDAYQRLFRPATPPHIGDDDMSIRLLTFTDADAQIVALCAEDPTHGTTAYEGWWTGPGGQASDDRLRVLRNNGMTDLPGLVVANIATMRLVEGPAGLLPTGDSKHTWTGDEVLNAAEVKARLVPPTAVDSVARGQAASASAVAASAAQSVSTLRSNLHQV